MAILFLKEGNTVKNKIFTGKFVLAPGFTGASGMEGYYEYKLA